MRTLKELIAWGGYAHTTSLSNDTGWEHPWPVDHSLFNAFVDMTLQGIGLSGENIDLDVGTAIFARHVEKDLWNDAYVTQTEKQYWDKGCSWPMLTIFPALFETISGCSLLVTTMTQDNYAFIFSRKRNPECMSL